MSNTTASAFRGIPHNNPEQYGVAQSVAQRNLDPLVEGSSPSSVATLDMKLEQQQKQEFILTFKLKLISAFLILAIIASTSIIVFSNPIKNFIRSYKPLPTSQLHKQ